MDYIVPLSAAHVYANRLAPQKVNTMQQMIAVNSEVSMTSLDFLKNIINPARVECGESEVENRHFLSRVEDEIDDLGVAETFYVTT